MKTTLTCKYLSFFSIARENSFDQVLMEVVMRFFYELQSINDE